MGKVVGDSKDLVFNAAPLPKCKHCGRDKGQHRAGSLACPVGRGSFPSFSESATYEPRKVRPKPRTPQPPVTSVAGSLVQTRFKEVPRHVRDDLADAVLWARSVLEAHEGAGHRFQIHATGSLHVVCTLNHPDWTTDHIGPPMPNGADAVVMAVCDYLYGSA